MTAINWALAPEATHCAPQRVPGDGFWCAAFVRMEDGLAVKAWVLIDGVIVRVIEQPSVTRELIERLIPRPVEWNGQGLPPAGAVCESARQGIEPDWLPVKILCVGNARVFMRRVNDAGSDTGGYEFSRLIREMTFRPIRTPEQIAADERLAAINYMEIDAGISGSAFDGDPEARVWIKNLIDKGWRKPGADQ